MLNILNKYNDTIYENNDYYINVIYIINIYNYVNYNKCDNKINSKKFIKLYKLKNIITSIRKYKIFNNNIFNFIIKTVNYKVKKIYVCINELLINRFKFIDTYYNNLINYINDNLLLSNNKPLSDSVKLDSDDKMNSSGNDEQSYSIDISISISSTNYSYKKLSLINFNELCHEI